MSLEILESVDTERLSRMLAAFENGELYNQEIQPPDPIRPPIESYIGLAADTIPACDGFIPTSGTVLVYGMNNATGEMDEESSFTITAYSLWGTEIPSCSWVHLTREPFSGKYFAIPTGSTGCGLSGSGIIPSYICVDYKDCNAMCHTLKIPDSLGIVQDDVDCTIDPCIGCYMLGSQGQELMTIVDNQATNATFGSAVNALFFVGQNYPIIYFLDGLGTALDAWDIGIWSRVICPDTAGAGVFTILTTSDASAPTYQLQLRDSTGIIANSGDFSGFSPADPFRLVFTDNGSSVTAAVFKFIPSMTLLASVTATSTEVTNDYAMIYMNGSRVVLTGLTVNDTGGTIWSDNFIDTDGTLIQNHTPEVGCGGCGICAPTICVTFSGVTAGTVTTPCGSLAGCEAFNTPFELNLSACIYSGVVQLCEGGLSYNINLTPNTSDLTGLWTLVMKEGDTQATYEGDWDCHSDTTLTLTGATGDECVWSDTVAISIGTCAGGSGSGQWYCAELPQWYCATSP